MSHPSFLRRQLRRFVRNESGATAIEYSFIAVLIALAIITGARSLGNTIGAKIGAIAPKVGSTVTVP